MAQQAKLSVAQVAALEAGQATVDAAVVERLARALGVEAEDIALS